MSVSAFLHKSALNGALRYALALIAFATLLLIGSRTLRIENDFAAFLPRSTSPEERLLIAQLRDGLVSRLMLIALQGPDEKALAQSSRALAARLNRAPEFEYAANGSIEQFAAQRETLMRHRFSLSPAMNPDRFSVDALHAALLDQAAQMASPLGALSRSFIARDPTGEFLSTVRQFDSGAMPVLRHGVWFSADGKRAFLIAQTKAAGFDSERQELAMAAVSTALAADVSQTTAIVTGPGVFAAESRRLIRRDAELLSAASTLVILAMLIIVYRSALAVTLVLIPVAFGLTVGVLVVNAIFGSVHAITLGFAATLIGEAVDYPSYLLLNRGPTERVRDTAVRLRLTFRLAVLTTVVSAMALTLSSFAGLSQLGVLTMVGVLVAGLATQYLIPWLVGDRVLAFRQPVVPSLRSRLGGRWTRVVAAVVVVGAASWLAYQHPTWWQRDLAGISPVPSALRARDAALRREMGAPEVSVFVASRGGTQEAALVAAEGIVPVLRRWKQDGAIRSFDSPTWYVPPTSVQQMRLQALPEADVLAQRLTEALKGTPFKDDVFKPFVDEVRQAKSAALLTLATYAGTPLGARLGALVVEVDGVWLVLTSLGGVADPQKLAIELAAAPTSNSQVVDLSRVSSSMVDGFRREALSQAAWGVCLILLLLALGLRSAGRAFRVAVPAGAALVLTAAVLVGFGERLSVFHLVALLLVLGIGLNYALFFERTPVDADDASRTRLALAVCSTSTVVTFGLLALSSTPVLHAIGSTVALGAVIALLLSALWATPDASIRP